MNSGGKPLRAAVFADGLGAAAAAAAATADAVEGVPSCCSWERTCSTGPPGMNCTRTKLTSRMPKSVGTMSSSRRRT